MDCIHTYTLIKALQNRKVDTQEVSSVWDIKLFTVHFNASWRPSELGKGSFANTNSGKVIKLFEHIRTVSL